MRRFAARVCLAAGLGIAIPALPAFAEVLVLSGAERAPVAVVSLGYPLPTTGQSAAPTQPARERSQRSELLMLVVGLTVIGMITLWRG